ncbi:hypothetical protein E2C01_056416 [Portunus trituberculatus]|uniref:Uncharacterized protein n=1 Tax=Portunus trituberculatus TaxID=210409 RepID=A0A5B7GQ98_PORTR|nr:hypothetical protein [Portunus trituberculatus]
MHFSGDYKAILYTTLLCPALPRPTPSIRLFQPRMPAGHETENGTCPLISFPLHIQIRLKVKR